MSKHIFGPVARPTVKEAGALSEPVELIVKLGFAHASTAGDGRRQEAMA